MASSSIRSPSSREPPMCDIPPSIVRQPPPPRRPGKEEWNTEVEPFKFLVPSVHQIIRTYNPRRCKRNKLTTDIESLPNELLIEVLVRIPCQQDIYEARLVCRKWYRIIHTPNFMSAYLNISTYGLLLKSTDSESLLILPQRGGKFEMTQLRYKRKCEVTSSCNGLWLETNMKKNGHELFVTNPSTGQIVGLPPCVGNVSEGKYYGYDGKYAMGYSPASMEYKVFIFYPPPEGTTSRPFCHILTAGVDKTWRNVDLGLVSCEEALEAFRDIPLVTEGFIHWNRLYIHHVLTLNVETETITETPAPLPTIGSRCNIYLSTGKYLTLLSHFGECSWQVWELSLPETGEWRKKTHFCLEDHKERFKQLGVVPKEIFVLPVGWVKYPELLAMRAWSPKYYAVLLYNLVTQEIDEIGLPCHINTYRIAVHKSSFEWLDAVKPPRLVSI